MWNGHRLPMHATALRSIHTRTCWPSYKACKAKASCGFSQWAVPGSSELHIPGQRPRAAADIRRISDVLWRGARRCAVTVALSCFRLILPALGSTCWKVVLQAYCQPIYSAGVNGPRIALHRHDGRISRRPYCPEADLDSSTRVGSMGVHSGGNERLRM